MKRLLMVVLALALTVPASASVSDLPRDADGKIKRSSWQVRKFRAAHPCPATGRVTGTCTGYVVDHIWPLCAGGPDKAANMQWQTRAESLVKDRAEKTMCRHAL